MSSQSPSKMRFSELYFHGIFRYLEFVLNVFGGVVGLVWPAFFQVLFLPAFAETKSIEDPLVLFMCQQFALMALLIGLLLFFVLRSRDPWVIRTFLSCFLITDWALIVTFALLARHTGWDWAVQFNIGITLFLHLSRWPYILKPERALPLPVAA